MTGVRQGECLSLILFALYLNDLEQELITRGADGVDTDLLLETIPTPLCV